MKSLKQAVRLVGALFAGAFIGILFGSGPACIVLLAFIYSEI
jgi:hypothetical protein